LALSMSVIAPVATHWGQALPGLASPRFAEISARTRDTAIETGVALRESLLQKTPDEARALVQAVLAEIIGEVLRLPADRLRPQAKLADIGIDSLINVEVRLAIEERFGANLPLVTISDETTLGHMADTILRAIGIGAEAPSLAMQLAQRNEGDAAWLPEMQHSNAAE
jgi:phthiocerol/phenolphthiocerol synthesis type-I polyketide synthase C